MSVPAGSVGTQSKVTPPMVTASPSTAPALASCLLDAEPVEPVGEEADGLVVAEVGLPHPALGPDAVHDEAVRIVRVALDGEAGVVDGLRREGDPGRLHRRQARAVRLDGARPARSRTRSAPRRSRR